MPPAIIQVQNLSKRYRIGRRRQERYTALRDVLTESAKQLFQNGFSLRAFGKKEEYWALRDVGFEVKEGEVVGLIGRNGAGKSTLLKLLSQITEPTTGRIALRGQVASLLEVGTGFHPELTGRENIFLSGALLGMNRREIKRKFDEIIDFSGVEPYIDTPVKRFSSGMFVRLGFAVAAHLDVDILLVDEVLAVGDAEFQKKSMGKMGEVAKAGRTVIFVSHNLNLVKSLCERGIVMEKGKVVFDDTVTSSISYYLDQVIPNSRKDYSSHHTMIRKVALLKDDVPSDRFSIFSDWTAEVHFTSPKPLFYPILGIVIRDKLNVPIIGINNRHYNIRLGNKAVYEGTISIEIKKLPLMTGTYHLDVFLGDQTGDKEVLENVLSFVVESGETTQAATRLDDNLNRIFLEDVSWRYR